MNLNNFPQRFSENCRHPTWPASGPLSRCGDSCARPLPAWLRRRDLALSSGSDGDTSVLRGCFSTERLSSSFLKRKTGRTRAPTADPVGPHSSRGGRTLSWEAHLPPHPVLSPALPTHPALPRLLLCLVSLLRVWACHPMVSTLGDCLRSARAQITSETEGHRVNSNIGHPRKT